MQKQPQIRSAPFKQGEFDGLCGVYAVLNALAILYPDAERAFHRHCFRRLVGHIVRHMTPSTVMRGTGPRQLWTLIQLAQRLVRQELQCSLLIEWAKAPFDRDGPARKACGDMEVVAGDLI